MTTKPSIFAIALVVATMSIFLLGGGIYDFLLGLQGELLVAAFAGGRIITVFPRALNEQILVESIMVMIYYAMGVVGFILTYRSTKYVYRPRQAFILLLVGCVLIGAAYIFVEQSLLAKWA